MKNNLGNIHKDSSAAVSLCSKARFLSPPGIKIDLENKLICLATRNIDTSICCLQTN